MKGRSLLLSSAVLALVGCGGDDGGSVSGVWVGEYTGVVQGDTVVGVQIGALQTGQGKGPICLEINQNGAQLSGKAWVAGYIWGGNYSGTVSGSTFTGQVNGETLNSNNVTVNFDGNVSGDQISGTVTVEVTDPATSTTTTYTYDVTLTKKTNKSSCGWASRGLVDAFATALGSASGDTGLGTVLASFITQVPRVDVSIDGGPLQNWWVCIWEVREYNYDSFCNINVTKEYTVGGIINDQTFNQAIGWYVEELNNLNSPPHYIGLDIDLLSRNVNIQGLSSTTSLFAGYFDFSNLSNSFTANGGTEDVYQTQGTTLDPNTSPFYVSDCILDNQDNQYYQYKVWMTTINDFCITFNTTTPTNRSASAPPDACTGTETVDALYIEKVPCDCPS